MTATHLWLLDFTTQSIPRIAWQTVLSEDEQFRLDRIRHPETRQGFLITRFALRSLLAEHLQCEPQHFQFIYSERGKPSIVHDHQRIYFNVSHSHGRGMIALSRHSDVGVDIEHMRELDTWPDMARRFFSPEEYVMLESAPEQDRLMLFYRLWTLKEAYVKAHGQGIAYGLSRFTIDFRTQPIRLQYDKKDRRHENAWHFHCVEIDHEYIAAVVDQQDAEVKWRQWRYES